MSDKQQDRVELTPAAAVTELRSHAWALRPEVLGALMSMAQEGRLIEAVHSHMPEAAEIEAAKRGRPVQIRGGVVGIPLKGLLAPVGGLLAALFGIEDPVTTFRRRLHNALEDPEVGGIVLNIDSPGGVVSNIPETAAEVRAAREAKPIFAIANTQAASAAYWIGSQATEFVVSPSADAGSIGVYATHQDLSGRAAQMGVKVTLVSAGKYKISGNPYEPLTEEARALIQEDVDTYYDMFTADVAAGRSKALGKRLSAEDVKNGFGEGRSLTAQAAVDAGIADRIESLGGLVARLVSRSGSGSPAAEDTGAALNAGGTTEDLPDNQAEADAGADEALTAEERAALLAVIG